MSQILLDKIKNILDINKDASYLNQTLQNDNEYIDLSLVFQNPEILKIINDNVFEYEFNPNYQNILNEVEKINNYDDLKLFMQNNNLSDLKIGFRENEYSIPLSKKATQQEKEKALAETQILKNEHFLYEKKEIYNEIKKYLLKDLEIFKNINDLAKKLFIETGKPLLRFANIFIEGDINKNHLRAPLFLYDIEIEIKENKLILTKKPEKILNEKLIIFLAKELKIDYQKWNFNEIKTIDNFKEKFEPYLKYQIIDNDELDGEHYSNGIYRTLKIINYCLIGIFDVKPGKIKEDFIEIMNQDIDLFKNKMNHDFDYYTQSEFINNALVQINKPLNIYQKYAIRSAINENTLIYGPPGTGKSEIITSIIANLLINEKSILIVSEKDAALEVIKKRLNKLSKFAFYLKDIANEKEFYEQIQSISTYMGSFYNIKDESFNIKNEYENNDRIKDYNLAIERFRKILKEDIEFSLQKDSRNNDYKNYLLSVNEVNKFVDENKQEIEEYFNEYKNKFVKLQTPTEFIAKVAQYNDFREHYELTEEEVNKFEQYKIEINKFFAQYDLFDKKVLNYDTLSKEINLLDSFINNLLLNKDKDFMDSITNDCSLLINNYQIFNEINELIKDLENKNQIIKFLITNCTRHDKFIATYLNTPKSSQKDLINRYFFKNEIVSKKLMFKKVKNEDFYTLFVKAIQLFTKIKIFKNNQYLIELIKLDKNILDPINIFLYTNPQIFKKQIIEYYENSIINFDNRIIKQYYKYKVNNIERELININVYTSEKLNKNKFIIERDLNYLINQYLKDNHDFILNMDDAVSEIYLKYLKVKLSKLDSSLQEKMKKMFQIVQMEIKPKINDFIWEFIDCLKIIFPIWISKPELISFYTENKENSFDVGIFDEASQMFLERAYPMLYRTKNYIIAGDDKQLKPERLNFNELDLDPSYRPLVKQIEFDYSESLLDRAKVSYWNTYSLRNHYRSQAKELIEFSNIKFYDNNLLFSTINHNKILTPLEVLEVKAKETKDTNNDQAKLVIKNIKENLNNFIKILVICFTQEQKKLILNLLNKEKSLDIDQKIKDKNLIIGDLSSVQGDEGDLVIISTVYSKESKNYGLVTQPRGKNYLNVAISRAKDKMIIIKSISENEVTIDLNSAYDDQKIFKQWIGYLDDHKKNNKHQLEIINKQATNLSRFKIDVYESLINDLRFKKINIIQNLAIGTTKIDLAFYSKTINNIELVVILDDYKKNISIQSWFEDIDCEEYLKSRNYNVLRIREQDWLKNKNLVIHQLINKLGLNEDINIKEVNKKTIISKSKNKKKQIEKKVKKKK